MNAPSVNPRRAKYTGRKRQQRAAMGERWRAVEVAAQREAGNRLLGTREAWRRWSNEVVDDFALSA